MNDENGKLKVRCNYFKEESSNCPCKTCVFHNIRPERVCPDLFYGCRKLLIDWTTYLRFKEHVTIIEELS